MSLTIAPSMGRRGGGGSSNLPNKPTTPGSYALDVDGSGEAAWSTTPTFDTVGVKSAIFSTPNEGAVLYYVDVEGNPTVAAAGNVDGALVPAGLMASVLNLLDYGFATYGTLHPDALAPATATQLIISAATTYSIGLDASDTGVLGNLAVQDQTVLNDLEVDGQTLLLSAVEIDATTWFNGPVLDIDQEPGTGGQILSSLGNSVSWVDPP